MRAREGALQHIQVHSLIFGNGGDGAQAKVDDDLPTSALPSGHQPHFLSIHSCERGLFAEDHVHRLQRSHTA